MCTARARFQPVKIRAHIVPWQVHHLAPELPIFLDLRLGLRRSPSELAVGIACRRDPPHRRFEGRGRDAESRSCRARPHASGPVRRRWRSRRITRRLRAVLDRAKADGTICGSVASKDAATMFLSLI
jgi:hypothetical protein